MSGYMILKKNKKRGSVLIEALLSVVILSVSVTLIIQSMISSLKASKYCADYTIASILLEEKMFELRKTGIVQSMGLSEDAVVVNNKKYEYDYEITSLLSGDETDQENLNKIDLKVSWLSGSKRNNLKASTYIFIEGENKDE